MQFPLTARFKLLAIAQQVRVTDSGGALLYYIRQKAFKLREAVTVFEDEAQTRPAFTIQADRVLDISAGYAITAADGTRAAVLQRHGMQSFWRTRYTIDAGAHGTFTIHEKNPWIQVANGVLESIPFLGALSGYLFHPAYEVSGADGRPVLHVEKRPALFEGIFEISRTGTADDEAMEVLVVGALMMVLVERSSG